ncbi:hypothetical protein EAF00_008960 [Botryotinia globosa]|nr:hypothetical protein EAF00_008960 [Botryotinia globosa]
MILRTTHFSLSPRYSTVQYGTITGENDIRGIKADLRPQTLREMWTICGQSSRDASFTRVKSQDSRLKTQDSRLKTQDSRLKTQDIVA